MNPNDGGLSSPSDKQRQAAAAIARQKVLAAYKVKPENYAAPADEASAKTQKVDQEEWKKYHSAWQQYYQKYYSTYYTKAAKTYLEQEKLKIERAKIENPITPAQSSEISPEEVLKKEQNTIREKIRNKASERARKLRKSRHFIPIVIGLSIVILGVLVQYNQLIFANVAAYVSPGGGNSDEISAIDPTVSSTVGPDPLLIIPKLNVKVPVAFGTASDQKSMGTAMLNGVAHFSIANANALPGQIGNFVISGHSAGNVYWNSEYKFIFSGLDRLDTGDLIYVNYNYSMTGKITVEPSDVAALQKITSDNPTKPMITLITCTPLGTSRYRLLVYAEQISPNPSNASSAEPTPNDSKTENVSMPANEPSPLESLWLWLTGQS